MKTTLSEQSRRTLHRSAWLAAAIIMLYATPITAVALFVGCDSALILSVALLAAIPIVVASIKFFSVCSPKLATPAAKSMIRAVILAAMVGATLAAAAIYFVHILNLNEHLDSWLDAADIVFSSILLATSFLSTIALCIMVLRHETAATQRVTKRMRLILILLITGAISVLMMLMPILLYVVIYLGAPIICIIGWLINDRIDRLHCNFNIYKQMLVGYSITAVSFLLNFPFRAISIIVFAFALTILPMMLPHKFIAPKPIKMHDTIYNRLAAVLTLITPVFLAIPMIVVNGAIVPITVARFCSRRALRQDSNDRFAKACLILNNCNIVLCVVMFLARWNLLHPIMNIIK